MDATQTLLDGRYRLEEHIGRGAVADVYRATDTRERRSVAVKLLTPAAARQDDLRARFEREAHIAAWLRHDHVVAVLGAGRDRDGCPYLVLEYVSGESLATLVERDGPLAPDRALAITLAVADAVGAAHALGIVHRDVKPSNVLLDTAGRVRVTDFGVAHLDHDTRMTSTGAVVGSPGYLAPEQARAEPVDARADVYALGCLLVTLLTGRPPFDAEEPHAVIHQHLTAEPPSLRERRPELPAALDPVVRRALAKDPDARYPGVAALARDLDGLAGADAETTLVLPDAPRPEVPTPEATRSERTRPAAADETRRLESRPAAADETRQLRTRPAAGGASTPSVLSRARRLPVPFWLRPLLVVGVAALALFGVVLGLWAATTGDPRDGAAQEDQADEGDPIEPGSAEPEPEPAEPEPDAVRQAVDDLGAAIDDGRGRAMKGKLANDLEDELGEVSEDLAEGEVDEALDTARELRAEIGELAAEGEIDDEAAARLRTHADELLAALERRTARGR